MEYPILYVMCINMSYRVLCILCTMYAYMFYIFHMLVLLLLLLLLLSLSLWLHIAVFVIIHMYIYIYICIACCAFCLLYGHDMADGLSRGEAATQACSALQSSLGLDLAHNQSKAGMEETDMGFP